MALIAVLDYGIGNLHSAQKALQRVGADARLTADPALIRDAAGVVLPGVGNFGRCMEALEDRGLDELAIECATSDRPFLGVCIGMQMLFEGSEESPTVPGLGVLPGMVRRLPDGVKRPQMQWNVLVPRGAGEPGGLLAGVPQPAWVYFVHSFAADNDQHAVATCDYGGHPVAQARSFAAAGAPWIHVVDLDAARTGDPRNRDLVAAIAAAVDVPVQTGGGVRDDAAADALLGSGVRRVVVGTAALDDPGWVRRLAGRYPGQVAVGLDARGRDVAVRGWVEGSGHDLVDVARRFDDAGVAALVVTEIGRDGTLEGPALDQLSDVLAATTLDVVASGGVGSLDHLRALAALDVDGRGLAGAIVGRALYEGAFLLSDAVEVTVDA